MATEDASKYSIDVECLEEDVDSDDEYICDVWQEVEEECEPLDTYATGGSRGSHAPLLYPIEIGQRLNNGRYQVLHRLGHGGFSTVWMAKDTNDPENAEVVAIKVIANENADGTDSDDGDKEYQMHKLIDLETSKTKKPHLLLYQSTLTIEGPRGHHRVLVLPLAGPGLDSLSVTPEIRVTDRPIQYRMSAAKQLLGAVNALHQAGLVHSDISTSNVLWQIKPEFNRKLAHNSNIMADPKKIGFKTRWKGKDGEEITASGERVLPARFPQDSIGDKIFLSDFGNTVKAGTSVSDNSMGVQKFLSPDRFHGHDPSPGSDMWSFMVVFIYLYIGRYPFHAGMFSEKPSDFVRDVVSRLGPLPSEWAERKRPSFESEWYRGASSSEFPNRDKTLECQLDHDLAELEKRRAAKGDNGGTALAEEIKVKRKAKPHVLNVINKVFRFKPQERIKASELLEDVDWRKLMEYCGVSDLRGASRRAGYQYSPFEVEQWL